MCVSNPAMSGHYYASGRSTPTKTNPVSTVFLFYCAVNLLKNVWYYKGLQLNLKRQDKKEIKPKHTVLLQGARYVTSSRIFEP